MTQQRNSMDNQALEDIGTSPDISVCILRWKRSDLLNRCLASIYTTRQDATLEVSVVDIRSHDESPDMVPITETKEIHKYTVYQNSHHLINRTRINSPPSPYLCPLRVYRTTSICGLKHPSAASAHEGRVGYEGIPPFPLESRYDPGH